MGPEPLGLFAQRGLCVSDQAVPQRAPRLIRFAPVLGVGGIELVVGALQQKRADAQDRAAMRPFEKGFQFIIDGARAEDVELLAESTLHLDATMHDAVKLLAERL
ncbi:MAG TPA: hypothetical protein VHN20_06765, partial [Beijerinckiaceae bacterium]|nr:hypothetical protein [Beijerinckiaceae bacterium]